ncbi:MAG TPA: phosphoribosyltransferase [Gemmatimonadales bacterium]|nr:phosphoribosyltransferase [Gemmatimonadales bacterium]
MFFRNRVDAGHRLAEALERYRDSDPVVLGLPRGGIPVAFQVAHALDAPLDVLVVRKLGAPDQPELAIGAVAPGTRVLNDEVIRLLNISPEYIARVEARERRVVDERIARYRGNTPSVPIAGRTVIIVDDGIATGATARAAIAAVRALGAREVVVAAPVCSPEAKALLEETADQVVCLDAPPDFQAVGYWYEDFRQTTDDEVREYLLRSHREREARYHAMHGPHDG